MVGGLVIRGGALGAGHDPSPGASFEPSPPPIVLVDPTSNATAEPTAQPSIEPTAEASIDGGLFFADSFDTAAAWPTGQQEFVALDYDAGRYRLIADPTDLPS